MKIPWYIKWLSYVYEWEVETTSSDYNEALLVSVVDGRYQLSTPTAIYSWADKYDNFGHTFAQLDLDAINIKDVLILGFGLGSIPYLLEKKLGKQYQYTGVEIDEEVIYLASKYALSQLSSSISMIQADAHAFLLQDTHRYDLITMDIFIGHEIPDAFTTPDFMELLSDSLTADGLLLFNHLGQSPKDRKKAYAFLEEVMKPVFPKATALQIKGNVMLLSDSAYLLTSK